MKRAKNVLSDETRIDESPPVPDPSLEDELQAVEADPEAGASSRPEASNEPMAAAAPLAIDGAGREELIRQAAYRRYLERGGEGGDPVDDWLQAEAELFGPEGGGG